MDTTFLLFDIDGTLVSGATEAHRLALHGALKSVHGVNAERVRGPLSPAGRTDGEIARVILLEAGVSAERIDDRADRVRRECCRIYAELATADLSHTVLAGIPELLEELAARGEVRVGLLTGNFEPVARLKLARAGIGTWFAGCPGAFGSDSEDRTALPAIARRRAGSRGRPHPRGSTIVIGDTPRDIACAQADELRCVAVATGPHRAEELQAADWVAADARQVGKILTRATPGPG
ncbi:MAG: haloacid dehalogenase-like hydrolase [Actinomycetota bacterium]|nr:haloacid dehalogenase-like hydrolase [Actinomycetota bacterium]